MTLAHVKELLESGTLPSRADLPAAFDAVSANYDIGLQHYAENARLLESSEAPNSVIQMYVDFYGLIGTSAAESVLLDELDANSILAWLEAGYRMIGEFFGEGHVVGILPSSNSSGLVDAVGIMSTASGEPTTKIEGLSLANIIYSATSSRKPWAVLLPPER